MRYWYESDQYKMKPTNRFEYDNFYCIQEQVLAYVMGYDVL